jgi:nucleoside-diphosphate-sugar epimerase
VNIKGSFAARRVAVTGAGGFLGARLVRALRDVGAVVDAYSRADGFVLLRDEMDLAGVEHVFHLAAETGVPASWEAPEKFHLANAHGTVRVLDQCRRAGCSLSYIGAYIYGTPSSLPISETHALEPNNPYAFSKWMGEQACAWYAQYYRVPVTAIRLFNVYGPGQSNQFIVPRIVEQALDPGSSEIVLMDLNPKRDYLYVDDALKAFMMSAFPTDFHLYNVGSGESHSVQAVVDAVQMAAGTRKPVRAIGEERRNEIPDVRADCTRLTTETDWMPQHTLQEGITATVEGMKS